MLFSTRDVPHMHDMLDMLDMLDMPDVLDLSLPDLSFMPRVLQVLDAISQVCRV